MVESLRRVAVGTLFASIVAFAGSFSANLFTCNALDCGAAAFLSQAPVEPYVQPTIIFAGGLLWGVAMYGFWLSALGLLLLEFLKPKFLKKHIKRTRPNR
jgi:hypothetical protein